MDKLTNEDLSRTLLLFNRAVLELSPKYLDLPDCEMTYEVCKSLGKSIPKHIIWSLLLGLQFHLETQVLNQPNLKDKTPSLKSCYNCIHFGMCKWKGDPYMGTHSGGFPAKDYSDYRVEWYKLHGRNCTAYCQVSATSSSSSNETSTGR